MNKKIALLCSIALGTSLMAAPAFAAEREKEAPALYNVLVTANDAAVTAGVAPAPAKDTTVTTPSKGETKPTTETKPAEETKPVEEKPATSTIPSKVIVSDPTPTVAPKNATDPWFLVPAFEKDSEDK